MRTLLSKIVPKTLDKIAVELLGEGVTNGNMDKIEAIAGYCERYGLTTSDIKAYFPEWHTP